MDKAVKVEPDNHNGDGGQSSQSNPQAAAKAAEQHTTHTLRWRSRDKITLLTCNCAGTIQEVLTRSKKFENLAEKQQKELVVIKGGRAISSHFPCCLIDDEPLTITYIKAVDTSEQSAPPRITGQSGKPVLFHLSVRGGKDIKKILRNKTLKEDIDAITVYGYEGETVADALRRDGRLDDVVFEKNCELFQIDTGETIEFSNLVDHLNDKLFKISKTCPPNSQPGSSNEVMMPSVGQTSDSEGQQDPAQLPPTTDVGNDNIPNKKPKMGSMALRVHIIPESEKIKKQLTREFKSAVKELTTTKGSEPKSLSQIKNVFRVEYGKKAEACAEVKTMKRLMERSNSVCQVRINGRAEGTGFLLFDRFVLTNCHVINNVLDQNTEWLHEKVSVDFSFESLEEAVTGVDVEEVVGFEYWRNESGHYYDWALLKLGGDVGLPDCLLTYIGCLHKSGGICIIGHPDGGVKKVDPCFIIPPTNYKEIVGRHCKENPKGVWIDPRHYGKPDGPIQWVSHGFFKDVKEDVNQKKPIVAYETCFYHASSGSPVFDEHCNVIAIHSGGYYYYTEEDEGQSVIEYGYLMSNVIEHIIIQMVERKRFDVLKKYLSFDFAKKQELMDSVKKLVESRNLAGFRDALLSPEVTSDESLKSFFDFICQTPEPELMET